MVRCIVVKCQRMNPLFIILFRILQGDRLRKPTPEEERRWAGALFLVAVYFGLAALCIRYARHFWDSAGAVALTVAAAVVVSGFIFGVRVWEKHVPAKVSWVLAAIAWPVLFLLALTGHLS